MERSEGHIGHRQVGLTAMVGIAVEAASLAQFGLLFGTHPRVASRLLMCSQGSILCVNAWLIEPGLWVVCDENQSTKDP